MYRKIDIADIIGSAISRDANMHSITRFEIGKVIIDLRDDSHYLRVDHSPSAIRRVRHMSENTACLEDNNIVMPSNPQIRDRFVKSFHQLDYDVQLTVDQVVDFVLSR